MKTLLLVSTALTLGVGTALSVPEMAAAKKQTPTVTEVCAALVSEYPNAFPGMTSAEDMAMCEAFIAEEDDPVSLCKQFRDELRDQGFNQGRCVSYFMHLRNDARKGD